MSSMTSVLEINFPVVELDYCDMLDTVEAAKLKTLLKEDDHDQV